MNPISVYILSSDATSQRTSQVKSLFASGLFKVTITTISPPPGLQTNPSLSLGDALEAYRAQWCLDNARTQNPNGYVIIVKDTSVSNASPEDIANIVSSAISSTGWHVCYLCRWLDRCDLYTDKRPIAGTTTLIVKTQSPQGVQAILFSPSGRDIILGQQPLNNGQSFTPITKPLGTQLNQAITQGSLNATCVVPNLIEYDVTVSKDASDYAKLAECQYQGLPLSSSSTSTNLQQQGLSFGWFLLILLIIILLIGAYFYYQRRQSLSLLI